MYFALLYDYVPDYLERRQPLRQAHLDYAGRAYEEGKLILGGAFDRPPDGALLVFRAGGRADVEEFAKHDPYVVHGIVASWRVRDWTVVIGGGPEQKAKNPGMGK
ncbi:MAG: YciI-like protein [Terriglobia bacterium]